jgi:hypothetical protein
MAMLPTLRRAFYVIALSAVIFVIPPKAFAAVSCTGSVDTHSVPPNSNNSMSFTVTNNGPSDADWVKISRPSGNFSISGGSSVPGGWSAAINGENTEMTVSGSTFAPGSNLTFSVQAASANTTAVSADWIMQISGDGGSTAADCAGDSRGTAIEGSVSVSDPAISDIVVSDISDTQAKISWVTDVSSTSVVDYGVTGEYGLSASGDSGTTHSVSLTGLAANTTYHYNVKSTRAEGNTGESGENTFTTAKAGTTTTVTVTGSTRTVTVVAPTPKPDTAPPRVTFSTKLTTPFVRAPEISGTATDPSGVSGLEYSLDDGRSWLPVDEMSRPGGNSTSFSFLPDNLLDDNYMVEVRATDGKGNKGITPAGTMVIDRLPPLVGGIILTLGPQVIRPLSDGSYGLTAGLDYRATASVIGGATGCTLSANGGTLVDLRKNAENGLWSGVVRFTGPGDNLLTADCADGALNKTTRELFRVQVTRGGLVTDGKNPVAGGSLFVYMKDSATGRFILWNGASYGQQNPTPLENGAYRVYIPSGTYYIRLVSRGFRTFVSNIFTLSRASAVDADIVLIRARALQVGPWLIPLPDFRQTKGDISFLFPGEPVNGTTSPVIGKEFPDFSFLNGTKTESVYDLRGKPTLVTFLVPWLPETPAQMASLEELAKSPSMNILVVMPQETVSRVSIFKKAGGYTVPVVADADGELIEPLSITSLPVHVFINRKGIITAVQTGVLNTGELGEAVVGSRL